MSYEMMQDIFLYGTEHHFKTIKGITKAHKLRGVIQSEMDACFYLLFATDKAIEGQRFEDFMPEFRRIE